MSSFLVNYLFISYNMMSFTLSHLGSICFKTYLVKRIHFRLISISQTGNDWRESLPKFAKAGKQCEFFFSLDLDLEIKRRSWVCRRCQDFNNGKNKSPDTQKEKNKRSERTGLISNLLNFQRKTKLFLFGRCRLHSQRWAGKSCQAVASDILFRFLNRLCTGTSIQLLQQEQN